MKVDNEVINSLLSALKLAKDELVFLYAQNQNDKFFSEDTEGKLSAINAAIKSAEETRLFTPEDFEGSGQYVIEDRDRHYKDTSYMTTLLYKVCYGIDNASLLVSMTDGMVMREFKSGSNLTENKRLLCEFLNTNNYRAATHEELVRMALHQNRRCK